MRNSDSVKAYIDSKGVHFDNAEIFEKLKKTTISATLVEGMLSCPAKMVFNKFLADEVIPPTPDSPLTRGIAFHRALELYYGISVDKRGADKINTGILSAAMRKAISEAPEEVRDDNTFISWLKNALNRYCQMKNDVINAQVATYVDNNGNDMLGLEMPVSGFIGNAKTRSFGMIDRLIVDENNKDAVIIDDYKSGAKAKEYDPNDRYADFGYVRQQVMYAMLLEKKGFKVTEGRLIYPVAELQGSARPGVVLKVDVNNEKFRKTTVSDVEKVSDMLISASDSNTYSCNPSPLCSWCPLVNICRQAMKPSKAKFVAAREAQPSEDKLSQVIVKQ